MPKRILPFLLLVGLMRGAETESAHTRAVALVRQMSLEEKVAQMQDEAPAIPRLGIPAYGWWNEALHGVARNGLATVFPQAIGLAATWDTDLEFRLADTISTEARAKYNLAIGQNQHGRYQGLTFWSPNINIFRDPRWGRGQETYGEDPVLTASMARQFIRGLQGSDPNYFKTIATSKHFAVHSGPETGRHSFDATVSPEELQSTYLPAFENTIAKGGAYSVMCAYNRVNGAPACANIDLLQKHLRQDWKFTGYVVSDCGAIGDIYTGHHFADSMAEAAAKAVKAGTDLDCGTEYRHLPEAVAKGLIDEKTIDESVARLMEARIRLGLFDPMERVSFNKIAADQIASADHAKVALETAEKSMVLLKNEHVLPWTKPPARIAVVGPAAGDPDTLLGNYYGTPPHLVTPLDAIGSEFSAKSKIDYALGSLYADSVPALIAVSDIEGDIQAEYFASEDLSGTPIMRRTERRPYFVWAMRDQALRDTLSKPTFSLRLTFTLRPHAGGTYQVGFAHQECDSCLGTSTTRLSLNGKQVVAEARKSAGGSGNKVAPIELQAGHEYKMELEYRQKDGGSGVEAVWEPPADALLQQAVEAARNSDAVVACVGLNSRLEGEESRVKIPGFAGGDRTSLDLPANQEKLLKALFATGKPVVVVLLNGSALAVNTAADQAAAILEAWYPGQEGGTAIAKTLSGANNPAGRLPVTFYRSVSQLPPFTDYSMQGRTYRFFLGKALYPFGYGLSYSEFQYEKLKESGQARSARVTNTSKRDGDEVVQLYEGMDNGLWQLAGFKRVHIPAGKSQIVRFPPSSKAARWEIAGGQPSAAQDLRRTNAAGR